MYKILQCRCPYSLYEAINLSKRDTSLNIILPKKSNTFLYMASQMWNTIHKRIISTEKGLDTSVNLVKLRTKKILLEAQALDLHNEWTYHNFKFPVLTSFQEYSLTTQASQEFFQVTRIVCFSLCFGTSKLAASQTQILLYCTTWSESWRHILGNFKRFITIIISDQ